MCCGDKTDLTSSGRNRLAEGIHIDDKTRSFTEQDEFMAAGIFRGEGHIGCHLNRRETQFGRHTELVAAVAMCDRDSIEIVARVFGSKVYHNGGGKCLGGTDAWQTRIFGVDRVKAVIGGWVSRGLLRGEKADQYFDALAKCRRAREIFLRDGVGTGRPRQVF